MNFVCVLLLVSLCVIDAGRTKEKIIIQSDDTYFLGNSSFPPDGLYAIIRNDALMSTVGQLSLQIANYANQYTYNHTFDQLFRSMPPYQGETSDATYDFSSFVFNINLENPSLTSTDPSEITISTYLPDIDSKLGRRFNLCSSSSTISVLLLGQTLVKMEMLKFTQQVTTLSRLSVKRYFCFLVSRICCKLYWKQRLLDCNGCRLELQ